MCKTIGIYGGTFSPPHLGHQNALKAFIEYVKPDVVYVIPTSLPPHKAYREEATGRDRLEMCRLAFEEIPGVTVSDMEIERGGLSYTSDTLRAFSQEGTKIAFLLGTDMMLTLHKWHEPEVIFSLCDLYCVRRENDSLVTEEIAKTNQMFLETYGKQVTVIPAPVLEGASSEIRETLKQGAEPSLMLENVSAYVRKKGLYQ